MKAQMTVAMGLVAAMLALEGRSALKPGSLFQDNMVLQQGLQVPVWGQAEPGERVTVKFDRQTVEATADTNGNWRLTLKALKASAEPQLLSIAAGTKTLTINNVLVGEVWICSGQSNMQFPLSYVVNGEIEVAQAKYPQIRMFTVPVGNARNPQTECGGQWSMCEPDKARWFSAVGYFFARHLHRELGVPVGMLNTSWNGSSIEPWTSLEALRNTAACSNRVAEFEKLETKGSTWDVSTIYNAMIAPLAPYAIRGAIWYQGESNAGQPREYEELLPVMIGDWRRTWGQGDFAFGIVQLANWQARQQAAIEPQSWAELRDSQTATLKTRNTGMAVTIDIGDAEDIHPKNKQDVGRRLGLWAQSEVYGKHCVYSGPMYRDMIVKGNQAILQFDHVGGGLVAKGEPLVGFAVAGDDKVFHVAQARIDGKRIVVSSDKVAGPVAVRYGWANNPICNLYNAEGLPASPFRTDDWTREEVKAAGEEKLNEPVVAAPSK